MNENTSSNSFTSASHRGLTAEAVSRRAYELWEQEGRPESRDLHHWLRAEKELLAEMQKPNAASAPAASTAPTQPAGPANTDVQPLQGTRAAAAVGRDSGSRPVGKRGTTPPFPSDKSGAQRTPPPSGLRPRG